MTIEKGALWGSTQVLPSGVVKVSDEASAAREVQSGARFVILESGDLIRALGRKPFSMKLRDGDHCQVLPCDALRVTIDESTTVTAISSVVVGSWMRPRWWVTSGGFLGALNVAPRAHPNDGFADALAFGEGVSVRTVMAIRKRMRLGDHLPHPLLTMSRHREVTWKGQQAAPLRIDGKRFPQATNVRIVVLPDAFSLCVPE